MKFIGIRGHRGSGKLTIAYLLANTLEFLIQGKKLDEYKENFSAWCQYVIEDKEIALNTNCDHVILEGFGDNPKMLIYMLTGIPMSYMGSDFYKDNIIINLKTFQHRNVDESFHPDLTTAKEYFESISLTSEPKPLTKDVYMTLREFIQYFGVYVMQNAFGLNVWVKSMIANQSYYDCLYQDDFNGYKIFFDVKARTEITYVKDKGGVIVKVSRPGHEKAGGMDLLKGDSRYDYEITNTEHLEDIADQILSIAKKIIES